MPAAITRPTLDRPITPQEAAVIRATLKQAATLPELPHLFDTVDQLHAISRCGGGCDGVDFARHHPGVDSKTIGDGVGTTPTGGRAGVIGWGTEHGSTGRQIYSLGTGDDSRNLPSPESIPR